MTKNRSISLQLNEQQLTYIQNALEEHFRLRMGQVNIGELTDDLASQNVDLSKENPNHDAEFDAYIQRRDIGLQILKQYMDVCLGPGTARRQKTQEVIDEIDLWHTIRHFLWSIRSEDDKEKTKYCTAADKPVQFGNEPLPIIKETEPNADNYASIESIIEAVRSEHLISSTDTINGRMFCDGWEAACDKMLEKLKR